MTIRSYTASPRPGPSIIMFTTSDHPSTISSHGTDCCDGPTCERPGAFRHASAGIPRPHGAVSIVRTRYIQILTPFPPLVTSSQACIPLDSDRNPETNEPRQTAHHVVAACTPHAGARRRFFVSILMGCAPALSGDCPDTATSPSSFRPHGCKGVGSCHGRVWTC